MKPMSEETERDLQQKVELLEKRLANDKKVQHNIIGMVIGLVIYGIFGFSTLGGFLGIAGAAIYIIANGAFF
jgi:hypothetical protein